MINIINILHKTRQEGSQCEKRISDYILSNHQDVLNMTIDELSEKTNTSYSSVNRLCKKAGVTGYKELKKFLAVEWQNNCIYIEQNRKSSNSLSLYQIQQRICNLYNHIIKDCLSTIKYDQLLSVASSILCAKHVYFIGQGTSAISAKYAYIKFFRLGVPCAFDDDSTIFKMHASLLSSGKILFCVSSSGRTKSIVESAHIAQIQGATVICLTDYETSPLTNYSNISLCTTFRTNYQSLSDDCPLLVGQIAIIDMIHSCCISQSSDMIKQFIETSQKQAHSEKINDS